MNMDRLYAAIGNRLRAERKSAGMTQNQVADRLQLSRASITNIERGRQRVQAHVLFEAAELFGVPVGQLFPNPEARSEEELPASATNLEPKKLEWVRRIAARVEKDEEHGT